MVSHSLTWNRHLWDQLVNKFIIRKKGVVQHLPDDIILDILSRLSAEDVRKCRRVCRKWRDLTTTSYFAERHLERSTLVTVMQLPLFRDSSWRGHKLDLFFLDEEAKRDMMIKKVYSKSLYVQQPHWNQIHVLIGSCNGLLLFDTHFVWDYFICNPVTREQITLRKPATNSFLCGVFFHSLTREYKLLWVYWEGKSPQYKTCILGTMLWRKLGPFHYVPKLNSGPIIMNGFLYWMVMNNYKKEVDIAPCSNSIMMFNMNDEKFLALPHPGDKCFQRLRHRSMYLLEMKGQLSFCFVYPHQVNIWVLEDHTNWVWVRKYTVHLEWSVKCSDMPLRYDGFNIGFNIKPVSIQNEELLLWCTKRGLFQYHLQLKTFRKIKRRGVKKLLRNFRFMLCATTYTKSFVSFRDFQRPR